jgi:predicted nucleic acid-binding protein
MRRASSSALRFLDTNVLLRFLAKPASPEDQAKAERSRDLLLRIERGEERVITSSLVIFETILTLHRSYRISKEEVRDRVTEILSLRGLQLSGKQLYVRALDMFARTSLSFADAYNAVAMQAVGAAEIYSWDTDFDRVPGIAQIEP